jgi:predicted enzyme related to lactoylglutathione lyase
MPNTACSRLGVRTALFGHLSGLELFPVSAASPRSHPKRLTPTVGRLLVEQGILIVGEYAMLEIGAIVWGVRDLHRAIQFWGEALDYKLTREPDVDFAILIPKEGEGIQFSLNAAVTSLQPKRHHIDLFTLDQAKEVERLLNLGATRVDWKYDDEADYVVLADPDGNTFCVVQVQS